MSRNDILQSMPTDIPPARNIMAISYIIYPHIYQVMTAVLHGHGDGETGRRRYSMTSEYEDFKCTGPDGKGCPHGVESDKLHTPRNTDLKLCDECYRKYRKKKE